MIIGIIFILLNIAAFLHAYSFTHFSDKGKTKHKNVQEITFLQKVQYLFTGYKLYKKTDFELPSERGYEYEDLTITGNYKVNCWFIKNEKSDDFVILFHGYTDCRSYLLDQSDVYYKLGFNVLMCEFPGHGSSEYNWTTIGYKEGAVVKDVLEYVQNKTEGKIVLDGMSLGAAAILASFSQYNIEPDGVVVEMPYSSMLKTVRERIKILGAPFSFPFAEMLVFWGGIIHGYNSFALQPAEYAKSVDVPILVLCGEKDDRATVSEVKKIYANVPSEKKLYIFKDLPHKYPVREKREEYTELIKEFTDSIRGE